MLNSLIANLIRAATLVLSLLIFTSQLQAQDFPGDRPSFHGSNFDQETTDKQSGDIQVLPQLSPGITAIVIMLNDVPDGSYILELIDPPGKIVTGLKVFVGPDTPSKLDYTLEDRDPDSGIYTAVVKTPWGQVVKRIYVP